MADTPPARLDPLPEGEWDPRLDQELAALNPVLDVHRMMAHHPELLKAWSPLRHHIVTGGSLHPRHRELVILTVAHHTDTAYEWHHHVIRGLLAGVDEEEIAAIRNDAPHDWSLEDASILAATDELVAGRFINDRTWDALRSHFSIEQILDLIFTVGVYITLAMVIGVTGIQIEAGD